MEVTQKRLCLSTLINAVFKIRFITFCVCTHSLVTTVTKLITKVLTGERSYSVHSSLLLSDFSFHYVSSYCRLTEGLGKCQMRRCKYDTVLPIWRVKKNPEN